METIVCFPSKVFNTVKKENKNHTCKAAAISTISFLSDDGVIIILEDVSVAAVVGRRSDFHAHLRNVRGHH